MSEWQLSHLSSVSCHQKKVHLWSPSNFWLFWVHLCISVANHSDSLCVLWKGLYLFCISAAIFVSWLLVKCDIEMASTLRWSLISVSILDGRWLSACLLEALPCLVCRWWSCHTAADGVTFSATWLKLQWNSSCWSFLEVYDQSQQQIPSIQVGVELFTAKYDG